MTDPHTTEWIAEEFRASLRRMQANAWRQGYTAGNSNAMRRMSDEPKALISPNPYWEKSND